MNIWDILILLAVGVMIYFAVRAIRSGKAGSCHDCKGCNHNCAACAHPCPTHEATPHNTSAASSGKFVP